MALVVADMQISSDYTSLSAKLAGLFAEFYMLVGVYFLFHLAL